MPIRLPPLTMDLPPPLIRDVATLIRATTALIQCHPFPSLLLVLSLATEMPSYFWMPTRRIGDAFKIM
jgi:hypothetical protein